MPARFRDNRSECGECRPLKRRRGGALIAPLLKNRSLEAERGTLHLSFTRRRKAGGRLFVVVNLKMARGEGKLRIGKSPVRLSPSG